MMTPSYSSFQWSNTSRAMFGVEMSGDKTSSAVLLRPMLPLMGMSFLVLEVSGRPSLFKTPRLWERHIKEEKLINLYSLRVKKK